MTIFEGWKTSESKSPLSPHALNTGDISDWLIYMAELCADVYSFALKFNYMKLSLNLLVVDVSNSNISVVI